ECCADLLKAGGGAQFCSWSLSNNLFWTPKKVYNFALAISNDKTPIKENSGESDDDTDSESDWESNWAPDSESDSESDGETGQKADLHDLLTNPESGIEMPKWTMTKAKQQPRGQGFLG